MIPSVARKGDGENPSPQTNFTSTNLPLVLIHTSGATIPDEPKIPARFKLIWHSNGNRNFLSDSSLFAWINCGIEQRGSSSANFPKKSYGFEFRTPGGEDTSLAMPGMPAESDWILSANYSDKSFLRNTFAYAVARKMGHYAARTRYVEVILNGEYIGLYVLTEKIKRDANRVNISRLRPSDLSGANLTGGYIVKIDKSTGNDSEGFVSQFPPANQSGGQQIRFLYDYPDAEDLAEPQKQYIQSYIDSFETALNGPGFTSLQGYQKYADMHSFVDFFLLNEWSKNVDGYRISTYITKPKITQNGGKLRMGPVWDFDLGWRNADYCQGESPTGWAYQFGNVCPDDYWQPPTWWSRLREDSSFNRQLACRWIDIQSFLMTTEMQAAWIDSVTALLGESVQRNFIRWPILGEYVWPNPQPIPTTYNGEVAQFKFWLTQRANWISNQFNFDLCNPERVESLRSVPDWRPFPNPVSEIVFLEGLPATEYRLVRLFNAQGIEMKNIEFTHGFSDLRTLPKGVYWIWTKNYGRKSILRN